MQESVSTCLNCGAEAGGKFCPECGQSTKHGIPTLSELVRDTLGAIFSYDSKVWHTIGMLLRRPGQLTIDYFEGRRARYLNPFQIFFWLQAIAFVAHRAFFSDNAAAADAKQKTLLVIGIGIALGLNLVYIRRKLHFVFHLVAAVHLWAFLMLWLLSEYALVPGAVSLLIRLGVLHGTIQEGAFVTNSTIVALVTYMVFTIRRVYQVSWTYAILQTTGFLAIVIAVQAGRS